MRKVFTPTTRKVYSTQSPQSTGTPTTTIRRLHNNSLSSTPNNNNTESPRILKQTTITRQIGGHLGTQTTAVQQSSQQMKCYVCDCFVGGQGSLLMETTTGTTHTKLPNKIGRVIGESFVVIVRADDIVCKRCVGLFNQYDLVEQQLDSLRSQLMGFISKKYAIDGTADEAAGRMGPATKMVKLNSGQATESPTAAVQQNSVVRKVMAQTMPASPGSRKPPVKIYKCMSCEFTTNDLKQFTPHYAVCPGVTAENNGTTTTKSSAVTAASPQSAAVSTVSPATQAAKVLARRPVTQSLQKAESAANGIFSCAHPSCAYKTQNKAQYDEHVRRHQVKVKPFKCRICSARFEDRETASTHARAHSTEYYKCGTCSVAYRDRNQLIKHFEVHRNDGSGTQQIIIKANSGTPKPQPKTLAQPTANAARLLQETIDEACNDGAAPDTAVDAKNIHFFSCSICSLTFIQENYYTAHMETHKQPGAGAGGQPAKKAAGQVSIATSAASPKQQQATLAARKATNGQSLIKGENDDLESIFEKMHSDKSGGQQGNDGSATGIDMPALDQAEEDAGQSQSSGGVPVSMPSLDDDGEAGGAGAAANDEEAAAGGNTSAEGVPMEIEDMQTSVEGGEQLKFIVNENGQLLQLDNHILTDADGNQIIVQGADSEHLQQLLQSVAGLEGGTIQMIQGENNQMILVQQDGNEHQLIDASMLSADGQIVIQQGAGSGAEGEHSQDGQQQAQDEHQQQQQEQYDESDVAVLAAAAEQHEMLQATAVDESSQEDLGEGQAAVTGGEEEEASQEGQQPVQSDENSQAASEQAVSAVGGGEEEETSAGGEEGAAPSPVPEKASEQVAADEGVSQDGGEQEEEEGPTAAGEEATESTNEDGEEGGKGDQGNVSSTTTSADEKVDSQAETEEPDTAAAGGQKEDFGFF